MAILLENAILNGYNNRCQQGRQPGTIFKKEVIIMFTITVETEIKNLEKTGCTKGHINQCLHDKNMRERPNYLYFGKHVSKGTVLLHTCNGDFTLKFAEKDGWARSVEIL